MDRYREREERLFLAAYLLWMTYSVLRITMWGEIEAVDIVCQYLRKTAYLLLVIRFLLKKRYTKKDIAGIFLIISGCLLSAYSVYNTQLIAVVIFVCFAGDVRFEKILKYTLILQGAIMIVTIAASQAGIIEDAIWYEGERVRHSLGYQYCGYPAHLLLFMTLMWFCLRKKAYLADAVLLLAANYVMYAVTDSRTDFYLAVLGIVGFFVWGRSYRSKAIRMFRDFATKYGFGLLAVISIAAHMFYDPANAWMQKINQILNGRLELGYNAIQQYGFSLLGEKIKWYGQGSLKTNPDRIYNYVDCSFLKEALSYGVIFLLVLAAGYYLLGKYIAKHEEHMLGWATLMSLAYSVINAHLCVLTFNVFVLALGILFTDDTEKTVPEDDVPGKVMPENAVPENDKAQLWKEKLISVCGGIKVQVDGIITAFGACRCTRWKKKWVRTLRTLLFLAILGYVTSIQLQGSSYLVNRASLHRWVVCGILFILTMLCYEGSACKSFAGDRLFHFVFVFLVLACISDFFVSKKFSYSAFCLLVFGGLFCRIWCNMKQPGQLLEEFKWGYKIWFAAVVLYCIAVRPVMPGICYTGVFLSAKNFSISMVIAFVLFLSDFLNDRTGIINGAGAAASLYMVWTTQRVTVILIAGIAAAVYLMFWVFMWFGATSEIRTRRILSAVCAAVISIGIVLLLRYLLYQVSPVLKAQVTFGGEQREVINESVASALTGGGWLDTVRIKLWCCKEYIKQTNLLGHKYLAEIAGKTRWPENSISMNLFRYGLAAGAAYAVFLLYYLRQAVLVTVKQKEFFPLGLAGVSIAVSMLEVVEMPFVQIGWLVFYFGLAWVLVSGRREKQDEISQYKCG